MRLSPGFGIGCLCIISGFVYFRCGFVFPGFGLGFGFWYLVCVFHIFGIRYVVVYFRVLVQGVGSG